MSPSWKHDGTKEARLCGPNPDTGTTRMENITSSVSMSVSVPEEEAKRAGEKLGSRDSSTGFSLDLRGRSRPRWSSVMEHMLAHTEPWVPILAPKKVNKRMPSTISSALDTGTGEMAQGQKC